jgi:hypothetical protein
MSAQDIEEAKFNQDIQDFLSETGEFSEEALGDRLISYHNEVLDMGWTGGTGHALYLQGWFINYIRVGDYLILAVGFDGRDGKNLVKPVAIPISYFESNNPSANFSFEEMGDWDMVTSHQLIWEQNPDNIISRLDVVKGNPVIFSFYNNMSDGTIGKAIEMFGEGCEPYFSELKNTSDLVNRLMSEVSSNNENILSRGRAEYEFKSAYIPNMQSVDDLRSIDISDIPRTFRVASNLW